MNLAQCIDWQAVQEGRLGRPLQAPPPIPADALADPAVVAAHPGTQPWKIAQALRRGKLTYAALFAQAGIKNKSSFGAVLNQMCNRGQLAAEGEHGNRWYSLVAGTLPQVNEEA